MKAFLFLILFLSYSFAGFAQQDYPDSGFTNKAEAKNLMVNGKKEGKWVEYVDIDDNVIIDSTANYYRLTIYKAGKPKGIVKEYYRSGNIMKITPYSHGKKNGEETEYNVFGKIISKTEYKNGKKGLQLFLD